MWRFDRPERMAVTVAEALALARRGGDSAPGLERPRCRRGRGLGRGSLRRRGRAQPRSGSSSSTRRPDRTGLMAFERSDAFAHAHRRARPRGTALGRRWRWVEANLAEIADTAPHVANTRRGPGALHARRVGRMPSSAVPECGRTGSPPAGRRSRSSPRRSPASPRSTGSAASGPPSATGSSSRPRSAPTTRFQVPGARMWAGRCRASPWRARARDRTARAAASPTGAPRPPPAGRT